MNTIRSAIQCALAFAIGGILAAGPAFAEKPEWAGKGAKHERAERRDEGRAQRGGPAAAPRRHFEDRHHAMVREYYEQHYRGRGCPPGLAKKHNGCMPPGQARKWHVGRPLPPSVVYYSVPHDLVVKIGLPPPGYRYVRVAGDILMLAIGTGMVVDAITDLGR